MKYIIVVLLLLCSCNFKYESYNSSKMPLRQLVKSTENTKHTKASYFIVGNYSSEEGSQTKIKMYVFAEKLYSYKEYNISRIKIEINNTIDVPYLIINYQSTEKYNDLTLLEDVNARFIDIRTIVLVCPEKYLPEQLLPISLN